MTSRNSLIVDAACAMSAKRAATSEHPHDKVLAFVTRGPAASFCPLTCHGLADECSATVEVVTPATDSRAAAKCSGNFPPRFSARRMIPLHAFAESENFGATLGSKTSASEHAEYPLPALGESEMLSIQHSASTMKIAVGQVPKDSREISSIVGREQSWNIFPNEKLTSKFNSDSHRFVEEAAACATLKSFSLARDGQVLAGEAERQYVHSWQVPLATFAHILAARHIGPMPRQHGGSRLVDLNLELARHTRSLKADAEAARARE